MTLSEHLAELRARLLRCVFAVAVGFFVAYSFHKELFEIMARPVLRALRNHGISTLQALQVTETIAVYLQVSLVGAMVGTAPYLFYQAWAFVAPGLYARERRVVLLVAGMVSAFFLLGVLFCYFVFLPLVVDYLVGFTQESSSIRLFPTVEKTFSLVTLFPLLFGVLFQLPLAMFLLSLLGIIEHKTILKFSRYFIVFAFIVGAIFTPPDPLSQVLLAVPITMLFFVGVVFAWVGGLLRKGGQRTVGRVVAIAVVLVFASLVVGSVVIWNLPAREPDPASLVGEGSWFAVRANPSSRIGRSVMQALDVTAPTTRPVAWVLVTGGDQGRRVWTWGLDTPCEGAEDEGGVCRVVGAPETATNPPEVSLGEGPVSALIRPPCVVRIAPEDVSSDVTIRLEVAEESGGVIRIFWNVTGDIRSWRSWATRLQDLWAPGHVPGDLDQTPLGRALAWSGGDFEVLGEGDRVTILLTMTPVRAARSVAELVAALRRCDADGT